MPERTTELDSVYFYDGSLVTLGPNIIISDFDGPGTGELVFDDDDDDFTYEPGEPATFEGAPVTATASGTVSVGINLGILRVDLSEQVPVDAIQTAAGTYLHYPAGEPASLLGGLVSEILAVPGIGLILSGLGITDLVAYVEQNALLTFTLDQQIAIPVCFGAGTLILTNQGQKAVEKLVPGDKVITRDNGFQTVRWVGHTAVRAEGLYTPIEFQAGSIGNETLLRLSPEHRVLVTGWAPELLMGQPEVFVAAKHLVNDKNIRHAPGGIITYVHFMLDRHEIVFANGAQCESFHPGEVALQALDRDVRRELFSLFPELADTAALKDRRTARMDATRAVGEAVGRMSVTTEEADPSAEEAARAPAKDAGQDTAGDTKEPKVNGRHVLPETENLYREVMLDLI